MFTIMESLLAASAGLYMFIRIRRLLKYYGAKVRTVGMTVLNMILAACWAYCCLDLWTTRAMVLLHFTALFLLADLAAMLFWGIGRISPARDKGQGSRMYGILKKMYRSGVIPALAVAVLFVYGFFNMNHVRQTVYQVYTEKQLGEYRVVLMTDIHYGTIQDPDILKSKIEEINELHPDLVILGGDIVEEGTSGEAMREVFGLLGGMDSRYGVFYVYGNHDRQPYTENKTFTNEELQQAIEKSGIRILRDEYVEIGDDLILAGREDAIIARYFSWRMTPGELLEGADRNRFIIMADHEPVEAEENDAQGVDLLLSGHTHAGQIWPVGLFTELTGGLNYGEYVRGNCRVIVSSGVAGWGYTIRTGGHSEYVVVDISGRK